MPEYNPAYKEQRKQVKYKENRSVKKIYKTNEKSIDKQNEMLYFFCINKNGAVLRNAEQKRIQCAQTRRLKRMAAVKSRLRKEMT